jgi:S1-C subfamily serine protease
MKKILCACLILFFASCINTNKTIERKYEVCKLVKSVPMVMYGEKIGSGVLYKKDDHIMLITAAHVVNSDDTKAENKESIKVVGWDVNEDKINWVSLAEIVYKNDAADFAILCVDKEFPDMEFASFSHKPPEFGEEVLMIGSPMSDASTLTQGIISHPKRDPAMLLNSKHRYIHTDAAGYMGSSGGGLFRKEDGKCIGIVVMRNPSYSSMYAIRLVDIEDESKDYIVLSD